MRARATSFAQIRAAKAAAALAILAAWAAACGATSGAGVYGSDGGPSASGNGGSGATGEIDGSAPSSDASAAKSDASKAATLDCKGLCGKATKTLFTCDAAKCEATCKTREASATAQCASEWDTYIECAVLGGVVAKCEYNGRLTVTGCDDETSALTACLNKPRQCVSGCTNDAQCQSSCPTPNGTMTTCCDVTTGVCFVSTQSVCPTSTPPPPPPPSY